MDCMGAGFDPAPLHCDPDESRLTIMGVAGCLARKSEVASTPAGWSFRWKPWGQCSVTLTDPSARRGADKAKVLAAATDAVRWVSDNFTADALPKEPGTLTENRRSITAAIHVAQAANARARRKK